MSGTPRSARRRVRCATFVIALTLSVGIAGCGGGGGGGGGSSGGAPPPAAPSGLSYSVPGQLLVGLALSAVIPTVTGTVNTYAVSPNLPAGLSLDATSGVLSGTPTTPTPQGTYTITASNGGGSVSAQVQFAVNAGPVVSVSVQTQPDPNGFTLHYAWAATDGTVQSQDAATVSWQLPPGTGLHFLYVLVSNQHGGYSSRRLALNTDNIGNPVPTPPPVTLQAPAAPLPTIPGNSYRSYGMLWAVANGARQREVELSKGQMTTLMSGGTGTSPVSATTNDDGSLIFPPTSFTSPTFQCAFNPNPTLLDCSGFSKKAPLTSSAYSEWDNPVTISSGVGLSTFLNTATLLAHVQLTDGSLCGTHDEFFGVHSDASVKLTDSTGLGFTLPTNRYGDYTATGGASNLQLTVTCESAAPITVSGINLTPGATLTVPNIVIPASAPVITGMTATFNGSPAGTFLPPPSGLPSDAVDRSDQFLAFKGLDSRLGACQYYKAIGAVQSCGSNGELVNPVSFSDWQRAVQIGAGAPAGTQENFATYVNLWDLNLTRRHHAISYGNGKTAAYVCNHLGPTFAVTEAQSEVDAAIDNAAAKKNLVACVAMDFSVSSGVNGDKPFVRFMIFSPSGQLLPSVNLDGRSEKFVPGTCIVCHGGDYQAGPYPTDGSGRADLGAHFLPYDTANFAFSDKSGLTEADQGEQIYQLNQNVLNANPTSAESALIAGWYPNGSHTLNKAYVAPDWAVYGGNGSAAYLNFYAHSCRGCHIAMVPYYNFEFASGQNRIGSGGGPLYVGTSAQVSFVDFSGTVCFYPEKTTYHRMPNSLITYNRFWLSKGTGATDQLALLDQYWGLPTTSLAVSPCTSPATH
jgi:hypothetical protein